MKSGRGDSNEEEVASHAAARSPSPRGSKSSRSHQEQRKLSNGHPEEPGSPEQLVNNKDAWVVSENNASLDTDVPIHDQIKQGILGFVENEIKKTDAKPAYIFYSHDPSVTEETDRLTVKTLSRPSSGHHEKRSPSYRKKKKHNSKRDRDSHSEFDAPGPSLSALEKVDDYLREYNKEEVVTLSGDLEIEENDIENNNGNGVDSRFKHRKTRRKTRDERQSKASDVSPKVHSSSRVKKDNKPARPTDLSSVFGNLDANCQDFYLDNPFSSPSPVTSPSDGRVTSFTNRPDRVYLQNSGGGTFRAVSRTTLTDPQRTDEEKYLRFADLTPLDIALSVQKIWRNMAPACHGILGGLSLMHLLLITCTDGMDVGHLSFHAVVTMPFVTVYYFLCVLCLLSVLDRLDVTSVDSTRGLQPYFQPIVLVILYSACLLVCTSARMYDEEMLIQYGQMIDNATAANVTLRTMPVFYNTWTHLSIWRAVLSMLGLAYLVLTDPPDLLLASLTKLLQFKQTLQPIG